MIRNSRQAWEIGEIVKVGFVTGLQVVAKIPTPGDHRPDAYVLAKPGKVYVFVPHCGLSLVPAGVRPEECL